MVVSIILAVILVSRCYEFLAEQQYVRPPNVALNSLNLGSSPVNLTSSGLTVDLDLGIR